MKQRTKKRLWIALGAVVAAVVLLYGALWIYASDYYRADATATAFLSSDATLRIDGRLTVLPAATATDTALVFYPGGKVEATAYLPILEKIRDRCGITVVLVRMPFNLAVFDMNAADRVRAAFPEIRHWYVSGHSLGGAMASAYASKHADSLDGLILMGAYLYGGYPAADALTIYGEYNTEVADKVTYTENVVVLPGGNHAQFGNYGKQKGDADATISREAQQDAAVEAIAAFLAAREG